MLTRNLLVLALAALSAPAGANSHDKLKTAEKKSQSVFPGKPEPFKTISSLGNVTVRYRQIDGSICEGTPGVRSYTGYVDLAPDKHAFFWFFESRRDPTKDDITLWVDGGPGVDPSLALFQEMGPCRITESLGVKTFPHSWNQVSNLIFLSQPYGVGFSYQTKKKGWIDNFKGYGTVFYNSTYKKPNGRWSQADYAAFDTTQLAAQAAYSITQGFLGAVHKFDTKIDRLVNFNLWTRSYGGHYGPTFYRYFNEQNKKIAAGQQKGLNIRMNSLGISNGIFSETIQQPYYPEFAIHNTYGIKCYNESVYNYTQVSYNMPLGCHYWIRQCDLASRKYPFLQRLNCVSAQDKCVDDVEGGFYSFSDRGVLDIRVPKGEDGSPIPLLIAYMNKPEIQRGVGVDLNFTFYNQDTFNAFTESGDLFYPRFLDDLAYVLDQGVAVTLFYGDADYSCNWFGGEAISKVVKYKHHKEFLETGYTPLKVDGVIYGATRQYGNFSFTRVYESGHQVAYYQPKAAFAIFNRSIHNFDIATGTKIIGPQYGTKGKRRSTHTEPFVPLPKKTHAA